VVDPWGTVVADGSEREGIIVTTIDQDIVDDVRRRIPCAQHRRSF
jgi:predicted amidohydrolase